MAGWSNRTKNNSFKLEEGRLKIKNKFFFVRVLRHWRRLLKEDVDASFLKEFKVILDGSQGNLI